MLCLLRRWRLDADNTEHDHSSIQTPDVQPSSCDVEEHPPRLFDSRPTHEITHVRQVWVQQNDAVVVAIKQKHVAEDVDGDALRWVQAVWARPVSSAEWPYYLQPQTYYKVKSVLKLRRNAGERRSTLVVSYDWVLSKNRRSPLQGDLERKLRLERLITPWFEFFCHHFLSSFLYRKDCHQPFPSQRIRCINLSARSLVRVSPTSFATIIFKHWVKLQYLI